MRRSPKPRVRASSPFGLAALTVLALVGAGCGGNDGPGAEVPVDATTTTAPRTADVTIADTAFDPRRVEVAVGGSVTWVNEDMTEHQLASSGPNVIQSPLIGKAGTYTASFGEPGEYRYYCTIHNSMKGVVVVR